MYRKMWMPIEYRAERRLTEAVLLEKLYKIQKDVDYIYKKAFQPFFSAVKSGDWKTARLFMKGSVKPKYIASSELPSIESKNAHKKIRVDIFSHVYAPTLSTSAYYPKKSKIDLLVSSSLTDILDQMAEGFLRHGITTKLKDMTDEYLMASAFKYAGARIPSNQIVSLRNDMMGNVLKTTIMHELVHWIDDTKTGQLSKMFVDYDKGVKKIKDKKGRILPKEEIKLRKKIVNKGSSLTHASYYELQALIHEFAKYKSMVGNKRWDKMTLIDVFRSKITWTATLQGLQSISKREYEDLLKRIIKRMQREKLWGKNMNKFNKNDLYKFLSR